MTHLIQNCPLHPPLWQERWSAVITNSLTHTLHNAIVVVAYSSIVSSGRHTEWGRKMIIFNSRHRSKLCDVDGNCVLCIILIRLPTWGTVLWQPPLDVIRSLIRCPKEVGVWKSSRRVRKRTYGLLGHGSFLHDYKIIWRHCSICLQTDA